MGEHQYRIERSIQQIYDILNHWMNLPLNGQPPYSPLLEETVRLLKEELKLAGLKELHRPHEIKIIPDEPKWREPIRLEPIRLEPIRLEPKRLKTKTQKKSDGWRAPNKNQNKPVCRY